MALTQAQDANYKYFLESLDEWLEDIAYKEKYVVIHGQQVKNIQDEFEKAFEYAISHLPRDEFIIQQIISDESVNNFLAPAS